MNAFASLVGLTTRAWAHVGRTGGARPFFDDPPPRPASKQPAIFIDKDGTLVENVPYNVDPALLRFMPNACEALHALAAAGYLLVVVTNQSGLARGLFTRRQFAQMQLVLERRLRREAGVELTDLLLCPHAPDERGRPTCLCRKPSAGMLLRAALRHRIDLARSWMVGDTLDDVEAGHRAGCRGILLDSGGETLWRASPLRRPHAVCADWLDVAQAIRTAPAPAGLGVSPQPQHPQALR